ncbi:squalene/phytoene synthase family protein [uncultured Schumannella sp.]|uniref:phytoene/squalene synthase family protein n=1 Tax=uncultured Schumannella sp. TaxID=1195956 RepID=UPI0025D763CC|nr:squalene/phytoene synthase family protein [uncultured Schumannella sp.]
MSRRQRRAEKRADDGSPRLELYSSLAEETASLVIARYSTSFGMASRLLGAGVRQPIENLYALVRVADEVVDGGAEQAGLDTVVAARLLNELERETERAIDEGYSANLVVHAFARTARWAGFGSELTAPFFESMRMDLSMTRHDQDSFERYVYGSAEVVGLMCLAVFLADDGAERSAEDRETLVAGARALGSAFQKVNFLRDLSADVEALGRSYFPGLDPQHFTEEDKVRLLDDIDAELAIAAHSVPLLPGNARRGVSLAHALFGELSTRLRATPAERLLTTRIRVPDAVKLRLALAAGVRTAR